MSKSDGGNQEGSCDLMKTDANVVSGMLIGSEAGSVTVRWDWSAVSFTRTFKVQSQPSTIVNRN